MNFIGACPELVESFDVTIDYQQAREWGSYIYGEAQSSAFYISRGAWHVQFTRTSYPWSGPPPAYPIYDQTFSIRIYGDWTPTVGDYWWTGGWPCNSVSNSLFTASSVIVGQQAVNGLGYPCASTFGIDLGCPFCLGLVGANVIIGAATHVPYANYYAFSVRAVGTRIG